MSDEFDEVLDFPPPTHSAATLLPTPTGTQPQASRLVARLFAAANVPLRARLLGCLMRPLGPLAVAGVAAGAFAGFLNRHETAGAAIDLEAAARVSAGQVFELAHFVEQVEPQALQQFAGMVSSSPLALATFSASALALLYRALQASSSRPTLP